MQIDVDFELTQPWTILFGPSGSGKTTILRAITGLFEPDFANIVSYPRLDSSTKTGITLIDTSSGFGLPPHKRGMVLASQKPSLFPHMTVLQNIRFGYPRVPGGAEQEHLDELTAGIPKLFRIDHLLQRRPAQLSGGETQRVHLARATMARRIQVLLLDEPFTGLDHALRDELITDLLVWQEKSQVPILSVTHDVTEAFQLGAEVIKIAEGRVVQQGPVAEVLAGERERLLEQLNAAKSSPA
ncbi:MAG TPA: ATP-binding cassette domain-containing protein [Edaphobacter sp.]|jgi:molybdate transport system ATP-binding protein|nr:ATP-binding cassette domain-containing protein [Edaphobacter sp.]